jgi:two-component system response regulator RegA
MRVLADCNNNVSEAARRLGIYRSSLQRRLRKFAPRK